MTHYVGYWARLLLRMRQIMNFALNLLKSPSSLAGNMEGNEVGQKPDSSI